MRRFTMVFSACASVLGIAGLACSHEERFVSSHVLELRDDGAIQCDGRELCAADGIDKEPLLQHLHEVAAEMPRAPMDPKNPTGPHVPDGRLDVRISLSANCGALMRSTLALGHTGVQIWNLRLIPSTGALDQPCIAFHLPKDVGASVLPVAVERRAIVVRIEDGIGLKCIVAIPRSEHAPEDPAGRRVRFDESVVPDRKALRTLLAELHAQWPERGVEIVSPDTLLVEKLLEIVDVVRGLGFRSVDFGGGWIAD